jgi:hypothetical protein
MARKGLIALSAAAVMVAAMRAPVVTAGLLVTATDDTYTAVHDQPLSVGSGAGLLANDSGVAMTAARLTNPAHGTVTVNSNGSFTYRPSAGYVGADSFMYEAQVLNLGILVTDSAVVRLTVTNSAPIAANDSYSATTGVALSVPGPGVLANDNDPDGDTLTATLIDGGGNGSLDLSSNGGFSFKSGGSFTGARTFTYRASDGIATSATRTVTINVTAAAPTQTPTPAPTAAPTPAPTAAPTPQPTPGPTATPRPTVVPLPSLPVPTIVALPTLVPQPTSTPTAAARPTPTPTPRPSPGAGDRPASTDPSPEPSLAVPAGRITPSGGGSGSGPGQDQHPPTGRDAPPFLVPAGAEELDLDLVSISFTGFEWAVPALVLTVPGLLIVIAVLVQSLIGLAWLPVARRWLGNDGRRRPALSGAGGR